MKRCDSLVVLGLVVNFFATYPLPICSKEQLNHLSAGRLCVTGTLGLCDGVTASWKVTCSKVQRCEAILGADIGVCVCGGGGGGGEVRAPKSLQCTYLCSTYTYNTYVNMYESCESHFL